MTDELVDVSEFLEHHGVKGMKWGQRRAARRLAKGDAQFEKGAANFPKKARSQLLRDAEAHAEKDFASLEKRYAGKAEYMFGDIPIMPKKYYQEVESITNKHLDNLSSLYVNSSGTRRLTARIETDPDMGWETLLISTKEIEHSGTGNELRLKLIKNSDGFVTKVEFPEELFDLLDEEESMEQDSFDRTADFLEHHGVKGMKWGVRRRSRGSSGSVEKIKKGEPGLEGKGRLPSPEGKEAYKILTKQKKHGTVSLTNHELRTINARQKLEGEFIKANPRKTKLDKGHDKVKYYLAIGATAKTAYDLFNSPAGRALRNRGNKNATKRLTGVAFLSGFK